MTMVATPKAVEGASARAFLVRMIAGTVEEDEFPLRMNGTTTIGRKFCDIVVPEDTYLAERHASVVHGPDGFLLRDDGSVTGVFLKAAEGKSLEVSPGDLLRLGKQFLVFAYEANTHSFAHYDQSGTLVQRYDLGEGTIVLGRDAPDIVLDKGDMTLSRRHLSITLKGERVSIKDLKSVNGTYIKVRTALKLDDGGLFRVGQQAFKLSMQGTKAPAALRVSTRVSRPPSPAPTPTSANASPAAGFSVTVKNLGRALGFSQGESICGVLEKNGVKIVAECHAGICGSDPVRIVTGGNMLNPVGDEEKGTLEDICGLKPGEYRLACMAKPRASVEIETL
jgi:pSer/pThr/pTyr-binding forkhead associated (FHA) protein